jgi:hypothetical protein
MSIPGFSAEAALSAAMSATSHGRTSDRFIDRTGAHQVFLQTISSPIVPDPRSCHWICDEYGCVYHCGPWRIE